MTTILTVYKGRDNYHEIVLQEENDAGEMVPLTSSQMATITKMEIHYKNAYYDSDDYPDAFDWSTHAAEGKAVLNIGSLSLPVGKDPKTELIIYDPEHPDGRVWTDFTMAVNEEALPES